MFMIISQEKEEKNAAGKWSKSDDKMSHPRIWVTETGTVEV